MPHAGPGDYHWLEKPWQYKEVLPCSCIIVVVPTPTPISDPSNSSISLGSGMPLKDMCVKTLPLSMALLGGGSNYLEVFSYWDMTSKGVIRTQALPLSLPLLGSWSECILIYHVFPTWCADSVQASNHEDNWPGTRLTQCKCSPFMNWLS